MGAGKPSTNLNGRYINAFYALERDLDGRDVPPWFKDALAGARWRIYNLNR